MGGKFTKKRNCNGEGGLALGYKYRTEDGQRIFEHIEVAERTLGKKLPKGAIVHHADENKLNNDPQNLVICPSVAYHRLLHERIKALAACGDPDKRRCCYCGQWDDLDNMYRNEASFTQFHRPCRQKQRYQQTQEPA